MKKQLALICTLALASTVSAATTISGGSIDVFADALISWVSGSLGYIIALLGTFGSILWYLIGEGRAGAGQRSLFISITISFFVGGLVGITQTMMTIGDGAF